MRSVVHARRRERGVRRRHVDDARCVLPEHNTTLDSAVGVLQCLGAVGRDLGDARAVSRIGDRGGSTVEVHHQAVVNGVQRHLHGRRQVARPAGFAVRVGDGEAAGSLERRRAVGLRQRDALLECCHQSEHLERRAGLQVGLRVVESVAVVATEVAPDRAGPWIDRHHRCSQLGRLTLAEVVRRGEVRPLHLGIDGGGDAKTAGPDLLLGDVECAELGQYLLLDQSVGSVARRVAGNGLGIDDLRVLLRVGLFPVDRADRDHAVEDVLPAPFGSLEVGCRVVVGGRADRRREHSRLRQGDVGEVLVEVRLGRCRDTVGAATEVDGVEVRREDLFFGPLAGHLGGDREFTELALVAGLVAGQHVLHVLLGDGRATTRVLATGHLAPRRAGVTADREARVARELAVLGCDHGLLQHLRDLGDRHIGAVALRWHDSREFAAPGVDHRGDLTLLDVAGCGHLGAGVGHQEHRCHHQGESGEQRTAETDDPGDCLLPPSLLLDRAAAGGSAAAAAMLRGPTGPVGSVRAIAHKYFSIPSVPIPFEPIPSGPPPAPTSVAASAELFASRPPATRRVRRTRGRGGKPETYDWTRWFQLQVRHTSTTCTENSSWLTARRRISSVVRADPDTCPSLSPKTQDTMVTCSFRQIGHRTELGRP